MLPFASHYLTSWVHSCAQYMLNQAVDNAVCNFPISFPDKTTAKIYLFVIVNKQLLFENDCQISFIGDNFNDRRESSKQAFYDKREFWKKQVDELDIPLGTEAIFIIQGIAHTPETSFNPWHIPITYSRRESIGLKPHGGNGSSGGGIMLPNDDVQIQDMIKKTLCNYGVPEDRIPKIT